MEWNALTTLHAANAEHGAEVYRFLRDDCEAQFSGSELASQSGQLKEEL